MVSRDIGDDTGQRPDAQCGVIWDGEMVFRLRIRLQSNVAARLPDDLVPESPKGA
jgi:hypothetical protein